MPSKENESSKTFGIALWPFHHMAGITSLEEPTPETVKKLKPDYTIKAYHGSLWEYFEAHLRVWPFWTITLIALWFYPIE